MVEAMGVGEADSPNEFEFTSCSFTPSAWPIAFAKGFELPDTDGVSCFGCRLDASGDFASRFVDDYLCLGRFR